MLLSTHIECLKIVIMYFSKFQPESYHMKDHNNKTQQT